MKAFFSCIVVFLLTATVCYGQPGQPGMQRIHAAKVAYITDMMQLSEEQTVKFLPVYKEYEKELRETRQPYLKKYNISPEDDIATKMQIEDDLDYQQQVIELKRKYNDRFLKIITPKQLSDMYAGERAFRRELIQRLQERRGNMRPRR